MKMHEACYLKFTRPCSPVPIVFLTAVTICTFLLLLLYHNFNSVISRDGTYYIGQIHLWYESGCFSSLLEKNSSFYIPPLPLWLPRFFMYFGMTAEWSLVLLNMICGSLMPLAVYSIAHELCRNRRIAYASAMLMAVCPLQLKIGIEVQRDMIYLFFSSVFLYFFIIGAKRQKWQFWGIGGFFFSCQLLIRYETLEMLFPIFLYFILHLIVGKGERVKAFHLQGAFLGATVLTFVVLSNVMGIKLSDFLFMTNYQKIRQEKVQTLYLEEDS